MVDFLTDMAFLAARIPPVDLDHGAAVLSCLMLQYLHEGGKSQVGYLPAPQGLHPGKVQILDGDVPVLPGQRKRQLKVEVLPLVGDLSVDSGKGLPGLLPVIAAFDLPGETSVCLSECYQGFFEWLGRRYCTAVADGEERFEAEVHARYCGSRGICSDFVFPVSDDDEIDVSQGIPFDREGLDLPFYLPGLEEPVLLTTDGNKVTGDCIPGLFQGEALIGDSLPEGRRPYLPGGLCSLLFLGCLEKQLIAFFDALHHILGRLGAQLLPMGIARHFLHPGDLLHQPELVQVLPVPAVVPFMHGDTMIPDLRGNIYLPVQFPVALGGICLEYEGPHEFF